MEIVEFKNAIFKNPFIGENFTNHNIDPWRTGGGSQRLFRKIGSRSSVYSSESSVRKTGSYIYEDFMPTDGTDVKVRNGKRMRISRFFWPSSPK
jgi:inositol hexakisphosphate/diphosphoinositol-pentakisphosphate kinase